MYRFDWSDLLVGEFLEELAALDPDGPPLDGEVPASLTAVLRATGGLPLARSDWPAAHRTVVARRLLHEATTAFLCRRAGFTHPRTGALPRRQEGGRRTVDARARVDVNHAPVAALAALPGIGVALAERIVQARRGDGYFRSLDDLARRVHRLGVAGVERLAGVLEVRPPLPGAVVSGDVAQDLQALLALTAGRARGRALAGALEALAVFAAHDPHPATRLAFKREELEPDGEAAGQGWTPAEALQILTDGAYHAEVAVLLEQARHDVDVCLFFMALGGQDHPTRRLLELLVGKAQGGGRVRVLLDRDDQGDPYGSTLVNTPAARYLARHGVSVRYDPPRLLLHSKFIVVDSDAAVVGSHNWTTGSFFSYRDLSVVLRGAEAVAIWKARFEELWAQGEPVR